MLPGVPLLRETYGWDDVARRCRALHDDRPEGSFYLAVGGRTYPGASQLAFHLQAPAEVYGKNLVGQEALQYRYWAEPARLAGKDAVVVVEGGDPAGHVRDTLRPYFRAVEPAGDLLVPAGRLAHWSSRAVRFTLYRAYGYRPAPGAPTGESGLE